ncbi:MAG: MFS transporter [Solimonas sp.]
MAVVESGSKGVAAPADAGRQSGFFYGWIVVAMCGFGIACGMSVFVSSTIGLLAGPLSADLGWEPGKIFLAPMVAVICTILVGPFMGAIVDRFGARRIIAFSFVTEALTIASFHYLSDSLFGFYARYASLAILSTGTTAIAFAAVISHWFDRRRGVALGVALAGYGIGGVIWSLNTQWLFDHVGWRNALPIEGAFIAFVALPLLLLTLRDRPQDLGLLPDGAAAAGDAAGKVPAIDGLTLREAARTGRYWLLISVAFLIGFAIQALMLHLVPILKESGQSAQVAAAAQASLWMALVVGRVSTGWLMDRFFAPRVAVAFLVFPLIAILLLGSAIGAGPLGFVAALLVGLAAGSEVDVIAYLVSRNFGLKHYGRIYATFFSAFSLGGGTGPALTANLHDAAGHYGSLLYLHAAILVVAAILLWCFPRFRYNAPDLNAALA